ncbi:unnamed protein product [Caenorhabditis nigoni]
MAPSPNTPKSSDSISFNANSRSKSYTKRKTNGTREDPQKTAMDEKVGDQPVVPNSKSPEDNKKKEKDVGTKSEEVPVKNIKKKVEPPKKEEQEASIFEEVEGPAAPAQSGTHGIKNKMRWKIDVEGADVNGDQKMSEVLEKMAQLRKKSKMKKCKVLKANEKGGLIEDDDEPNEDHIINSARLLQVIKMEALISKELLESDQEILKGFCRSGDQEDKAEGFIEKIVLAVLNAIVQKNEFIRQVTISGQLRMLAVDEKKAKVPMMALLMARKDLLYVSWSKPNREVENTLDGTWAGMTVKKGTGAAVQSTLL